MPKLISTGTADAPYKIAQNQVKDFVYSLFSGVYSDVDRLISVFDNSNIETRHFSVPVDWVKTEHSFRERNQIFRETAIKLSTSAINRCLEKAGAGYGDINCIIFVTSTGVATPTIDAVLFNRLRLDKHIKRMPLWGLGCAGGGAAISRAMEYCRANPKHNALVVAVELCSLTFQKDDLSKSNIVASSLFSDGCAAALICGNESRLDSNQGVELIDSMSTIYDDSLDVMGWEIVDDGFRVLFSRDIPAIVKDLVHGNITEFLQKHSLSVSDLKHYVTHPGGQKVINAYEESLGITNGALDNSRKVLKEHGNMSSPSVLYVMDEFLKGSYNKSEYGLLSALGPGFSSELVLFKTE